MVCQCKWNYLKISIIPDNPVANCAQSCKFHTVFVMWSSESGKCHWRNVMVGIISLQDVWQTYLVFPEFVEKSLVDCTESQRERERTGYISETVSSVPVPVVSVLLVVRGGTWRPGAGLPPVSPQTRLLSYCHIVRSREDWGYILLFGTWSSSWSNIPASNQTSLRFDWKLEILVFYLKLLRSKCVPK